MYSYGQSGGSQVQHLPPLNYVSIPGPSSVPPSEGAPSPTPSGASNQPIVYHYSYHYTIQPGQTLPNGMPAPPGAPMQGVTSTQPNTQPPPALQMVNATPQQTQPSKPDSIPNGTNSVNYNLYSSSINKNTTSSTVVNKSENKSSSTVHHIHHYGPGSNEPKSNGPSSIPVTNGYGPCDPRSPLNRDGPGSPPGPCDPNYPGKMGRLGSPPRTNDDDPNRPGGPNSNISININKTMTHTTHYTGQRPDGTPLTSTPYHNRNRSRSPSPERYPRKVRDPNDPSTLYITRTSYSDSLERLRKPAHQGLPFPETSPIKPGNAKIPRHVDDLMEDFPDADVSFISGTIFLFFFEF